MGLNIKETGQKRIVIIGGGFAGIQLAQKLNKKNLQVVLLDKHNYHTFQPLLYQVATAGLEPDSIAYPLRKLFQKSKNCLFRLAEVKEILPASNLILTDIGELSYDYLVIATGSKTNFFNLKGVEEDAMPMKSIPQALNLRSLLLQNFEKAILTNDEAVRKALMNIVIVGGGPTGVELAGALAEMKRFVLPNDYPELDIEIMDINLFEASPKLLDAMSEEASDKAQRYLEGLGVKIHTGTRVTNYEDNEVTLSNGTTLHSENMIWAAGVTGATILGIPTAAIERGRIKVDAFNRIEGTENMFAIGDIAAFIPKEGERPLPMLAPVAIQQGQNLAKNIQNLIKGKELVPFEYNDKGSMATIGRNRAVVDLPFFKFQGLFAWIVWMFVHIVSLIGFRNRAAVLVNWVYSYFTYNRALRLIIRPFKK